MIRTNIMLHHSLTADGKTVSWKAIEEYHRKTMGWRDIGYHAGVELEQDQVNAHLGRDWTQQAAACPQGLMNLRALHVCIVGNYDLIEPSSEHLRVLVERVLLPWMHLFGITADHIVGHRDFNPDKSCPGHLFDIEKVKGMCR
jgi:N-acetylmuramoyl-L-alanine amidase